MSNFTNSKLATIRNTVHSKINGSGNFTRSITKITIHHAAGVINGASLLAWGHNSSCSASWNYGIGNDGVIGLMTEEKNRAWTSSSPANDYQAVTIEVGNSKGAPSWEISSNAMNALVNLCIDICKRNKILRLVYDGTPNGSLTLHEMFSNTNCPGPYIKSKLSYICDSVNKGLGATTVTPATPTTPEKVLYRVVCGSFEYMSKAEVRQAALKKVGIDSFLISERVDGKAMLRVIAGSFTERRNAEAQQVKLKKFGFDSFLIAETPSGEIKVGDKVKVTAPYAANAFAIATQSNAAVGQTRFITNIINDKSANFPYQLGIKPNDRTTTNTTGFAKITGIEKA